MSTNMHFNSVQAITQPTLYNYQQPSHHRHRHHHHHQQQQQQQQQQHFPSPLPTQSAPIHNPSSASSYSNHRLTNNSSTSNGNNSYPSRSSQLATPILSNHHHQSAAYFLDRIDLENYTTQTLKQTVENILSKTKSKGLKVKISLPDDGLIIENMTDPNQSWIFKTSELLYFWRDPYYLNVIVVVTINRAHNQYNRPYSASIFRLRGGTDSAQLFLQQAQQFFSNLQTLVNNSSNSSKSSRNKSGEKTVRTENSSSSSNNNNNNDNNNNNNKTKPTVISKTNEQSSTGTKSIPETNSTNIRRVTRAEFDPGKTVGIHSVDHRTYSETASSTDSQMNHSTRKSNDDDDDDKLTTVSNNLSMDQVAELMRELKELRNEIATLKLGKKSTPSTRSMSTSPLSVSPENLRRNNDSSASTTSPSFQEATSQSEIDAETQTDYSFVSHRRRQTSRKNKKTMIGSGGVSHFIKKKTSSSTSRNGRRTYSNSSTNTVSDQEEPSPSDRSSQVNDTIVDTNSIPPPPPLAAVEQYQPFILAAPPRPIVLRNSHNFSSSTNSSEEGSFNVTAEKDIPKFLSTNVSSSKSDLIGPTMSMNPLGTSSHFRPSVENSNNTSSTEHIYENVPILIQPNTNGDTLYNIPIINADESQQQQQQKANQSDHYAYYTINKSREIDSQQQYLIPGQIISNSPPTTDNNNNNILDHQSLIIPRQKPQIISAGRHRNQPIFFANHLTNPVFNVDKQLLINTIANQFGFDLNSPQLQQLISNQHLFAARKRTFANMVWQLTPDEETALCSSPHAAQTTSALVDIEASNSNARSILKAAKRLQTSSDKRRNISWDNALE